MRGLLVHSNTYSTDHIRRERLGVGAESPGGEWIHGG